MNPEFHEDVRYDYPLSTDSLVLDVGGYTGEFTRRINERYHCRIECFEPVVEYYLPLKSEFSNYGNIIVHPYGVSAETKQTTFKIKGNMAGEFADDGPEQIVQCLGLGTILDRANKHADLLKLNVEGMEYEILEWLLDSGRAREVNHIQVQFHPVALDSEERRDKIKQRLSRTHPITWDYLPWVWTSFSKQ